MILLPISTSTSVRRTPVVNYGLIAANVLVMMTLGASSSRSESGSGLAAWRELGVLNAGEPSLYQFITYQFLHGDIWHLAFNMLFLWVFGNPVNAKMGHFLYLCFYLAGGVFAAVGYAFGHDHRMVGASGSIAAVTTAYLALFPRSYITIIYWFVFIGTFELPSMIMIGVKMILYDNIIAPKYMSESNVAFGAHLAGYAFGFCAAAGLLALRVLPRDQFDIVALWRRWLQRRAMESAMASPDARARAQFGRVARPVSTDDVETVEQLDAIAELRMKIADLLARNDPDQAADIYAQLMEQDPRQVLGRPQQLDVANHLYAMNKLPQAAAAYEKYLTHYGQSPEADHVKLLLGIIYARDLQQYEVAEAHLSQLLDRIHDEKRLAQCRHWLDVALQGLGKPATGS